MRWLKKGKSQLLMGIATGIRIPAGACEKDVRDLGLGGVFHRVLRFHPPPTTGLLRLSHNMAEQAKIIKIPNP